MAKIPFKSNQFSLIRMLLIIVEREKEGNRGKNYSREHDFPAYPVSFLISPRFSIVFSHACQVALSPILQVMNNSHTVLYAVYNTE